MTTYDQPTQTVRTVDPAEDETRYHGAATDETQVHGTAQPAAQGYQSAGAELEDEIDPEGRQRERFGGLNWGASFFGWLVASGVAILVSGLLAGGVVALGGSADLLQAEAVGQGNVELAAAAILLGVLALAAYTGGYVAGRMSRFDGGRQGAGVWAIGLLMTAVVAGLGYVGATRADLLDSVNLSASELGGAVPASYAAAAGVGAAIVLLLAAVAGGKVGCRYHRKVDAAALG
ncbi:MAG TPA: hypothetical protein VLA97_10105 [Nocardioidaceae bacterium]|nr:hypothetical protein [Nocardioidaceae bacterium]